MPSPPTAVRVLSVDRIMLSGRNIEFTIMRNCQRFSVGPVRRVEQTGSRLTVAYLVTGQEEHAPMALKVYRGREIHIIGTLHTT